MIRRIIKCLKHCLNERSELISSLLAFLSSTDIDLNTDWSIVSLGPLLILAASFVSSLRCSFLSVSHERDKVEMMMSPHTIHFLLHSLTWSGWDLVNAWKSLKEYINSSCSHPHYDYPPLHLSLYARQCSERVLLPNQTSNCRGSHSSVTDKKYSCFECDARSQVRGSDNQHWLQDGGG